MPTYALSEDSCLQRAIDDWRMTASEEVYTIGGWRDASQSKRKSLYWSGRSSKPMARPREPEHFWGDTVYVFGQATARYPHLDATPLQDIHAAVKAWYEDRDASRIPLQAELLATLDRAITVVAAIEHCLHTRLLFEDDRELIRRLLLAKEPPRLSDDELDRLRSHLEAPADASLLHRDTQKPPRRRKLQDILAFNDELRKSGSSRSGKSRKVSKRKHMRRTTPTHKQMEAYALYLRLGSLRPVADELGLSYEGARKRVNGAKEALAAAKGRSVRARQRLPDD